MSLSRSPGLASAPRKGDRISAARDWIAALHQPHASLFLFLLLGGDLAFFALNFLNKLIPALHYELLNLERDHSYPEMYQYIKFLWIVLLLCYVAVEKRTFTYVPFALIYTYFLIDDAIQIHEKMGRIVGTDLHFAPMFWLRSQDFGELTVSGTAGMVFLSLLIWAYRKGSPMFRRTFKDILFLILVVVFFGVVIDMLDSALKLKGTPGMVFDLLEDGGEMLAVTITLWYVFLTKVRGEGVVSLLISPKHSS